MTTPPVWSNYPAEGETPSDGSQEPGFSELTGNPTQRPTTSSKPDRLVVIVIGVVVAIVTAAMIATVVSAQTRQPEIATSKVDQIFDPPLEGLRNAQNNRAQPASTYFKQRSGDRSCAFASLMEAEMVRELQSVEGASREFGWAVTWNSIIEAQRGFDSIKSSMPACREGLTVIELSDSPDRYASFSGTMNDDSPYDRIAMMQYGNVVVLTQLTGDRPMQSWSKAIANRVDLLA